MCAQKMLEHPRPTRLRLSPQHVQVGLTSEGTFLFRGSVSAPASHRCALCSSEGSEPWPPTAPGIYLRLAFLPLSDLSSIIIKARVENLFFFFLTVGVWGGHLTGSKSKIPSRRVACRYGTVLVYWKPSFGDFPSLLLTISFHL